MTAGENVLTNSKQYIALAKELKFTALPGFARFVRENHLRAYIQEQLNFSREVDLPLLKLFAHLSDEEMIAMGLDVHGSFLDAVADNRLKERLEHDLNTWMSDELGILRREDVTAEDITLGTYIRKKALITFLPLYTTDLRIAISIIHEIDEFSVIADTASTNVYLDILREKIGEQLKEVQRSNQSLEEYAYVASHDLKEPLRKISTFADRILVTQKHTLDEDGKMYMSKIMSSARRMQTMVDDLLTVSTISGNKTFEDTNLSELVAEALQPLEQRIEDKKAVIDVADLPVVPVVRSQFRQLFQNLVSNSLKFSRMDVPPRIVISARFVNGKDVPDLHLTKSSIYAQIEIQDNGIGFQDQYAENIFAIFKRLHGKTEYEGTGIGLAICKKIIDNHNGVIYAHGAPGEGAKFTIIIPTQQTQ